MKKNKKALSLIELITIIIILAILATITFISLQDVPTETIEQQETEEVIDEFIDKIQGNESINTSNQDQEDIQNNTINNENLSQEEQELQTIFEKLSLTDEGGNLELTSYMLEEPVVLSTNNFTIYRGQIDSEKLETSNNYYYTVIAKKNEPDGLLCLEITDTEYESSKPVDGLHRDNCDDEIKNNAELDNYIY